ncbi:MAG: LCP family protein, partial [Anaerolineales bacterium]|nr:LCP family protein [Anaerolineales bacterium]
MRRTSKRQPQRSTTATQKLLTAGLVVVFLMIAGVAALLVFDRVREMIAASTSLPELTVNQPAEETPVVQFDPLQLPQWTGVERVNILLLGIDQRDYEEGPWRTDTMIVLTIDPVTMTGGVLSIPRDLWVPIPGYNEARINTAHYFGDVYDYPGGGPALAVQTVEYNLGVPIHYYVRANFTAFEKIVDLIGGIDVVVPEEINDPKYPDRNSPGYDPLYIPAGRQHLDGEMALKYARTRYSPGADFDRAKRQQQVLDAILYRVTSLDMLPDLALKAPQLWQTLEGAVETDLSLEQIIALANLASEIEPEARRYGVINEKYTQNWTTPDGQQV